MAALEWSADFAEDGSLLTLSATGDLGREGLCESIDAVLAHKSWRPGIPTLCDFRRLNIFKLSAQDIEQLVEVHRRYSRLLHEHPAPIAVVVAKIVDYGMVRMWELFANDMFPLFRPFLRMEDALEWLKAGGKEPGGDA